jgi:ribosomal protein L32
VLQRILLIVAILFVIWRILSAWGRRLIRDSPGADSYSRFSPFKRSQRRRWHSEANSAPEELVACARCGTYVPVRRALSVGDDLRFCGEECREAHELPAAHGDRSD